MKGLMILLAAAFTFSAMVGAQAPIAPPKGNGFKLGVVDIEKCLKEYKKGDEQKKQMRDEIETRLRSISEEKRKVEGMKDNVDLYVKGSTEWIDMMKKIRLAEANIELDQQTLQFSYSQKFAGLILKLYEDVKREIKAVAESKGLNLVLTTVNSEIKATSETDVTNNIMVRQVIYSDPGLDITAEVVSRLNK